MGWAERPEVGIVGCKLIRPNGTIQHAGIVMGLGGHGSHVFDGDHENSYGPFGSPEWYRDYQAVTGACMAMRREVFEQLGGFDTAYQVGYNDIDICLRAVEAGLRVRSTPLRAGAAPRGRDTRPCAAAQRCRARVDADGARHPGWRPILQPESLAVRAAA